MRWMLQPVSVSHSGMKSQLFPETYSGSYLWFYFQRTGCQILSDIREKISLALLALTCVFYVRPVGAVFREERTCIAQLLPAFSLCPRVTTPSFRSPFPQSISPRCHLSRTSSVPLHLPALASPSQTSMQNQVPSSYFH